MSQSSILLSLQNTTPFVQPISVMNPNPSQVPDNGGAGNATQNSYTYDLSGELAESNNNNFTYLTVVYSINGGNYISTTIDYGAVIQTAYDVADALNTLNQSLFYAIDSLTLGVYSIATNGNNYYYSTISTNANYIINSFYGDSTFGIYGSFIYNKGFNQNGSGILTRINPLNTFWINYIPNNIDGSLNRSGIWSGNIPTPPNFAGYVGAYANINSVSNKTIYIGVASCYNPFKIYVNNSLIVSSNDFAISLSINTQTGLSVSNSTTTCWNIYPIDIISGNNLINVYSQVSAIFMPTGLAFEIYDNTASEIASATSYAQLNVLFSTANYTGVMI